MLIVPAGQNIDTRHGSKEEQSIYVPPFLINVQTMV